jgi:hypothetical protein
MTKKILVLNAVPAAPVAPAPMTIALPGSRGVSMGWKTNVQQAFSSETDAETAQVFVLIQEGGSSLELYIHAHSSRGEAEEDRVNCEDNGAYRTSEILEVPESLADMAGFYELAEKLVCAVAGVRSPFFGRDTAEIEVPDILAKHAHVYRSAEQLVGAVSTLDFPEEE